VFATVVQDERITSALGLVERIAMDRKSRIILRVAMVLQVCALIMLVRLAFVHSYRGGVLDRVSACSQEDIREGKSWEWRYDRYNEVSFDEMMLRPWVIPLKRFYRDDSFMRCDEA
jgi:hypothetical protein